LIFQSICKITFKLIILDIKHVKTQFQVHNLGHEPLYVTPQFQVHNLGHEPSVTTQFQVHNLGYEPCEEPVWYRGGGEKQGEPGFGQTLHHGHQPSELARLHR